MASAGANDAIQPTSCSSLDYGLWHAHDDPAGESSAPLKEFLPADLPYTVRQRSSDSVRFGELSRQRLTIKGPGKARELMLERSDSKRFPDKNNGTTYQLDPKGTATANYAVQKGDWEVVRSGIEPPALGRTWRWISKRKVGTTLSETAFSGSDPRFDPEWNIHFGLNATRPTFGRLKGEVCAHSANASLAENMTMDQALFSPFRTTTPSINPGSPAAVRAAISTAWAEGTTFPSLGGRDLNSPTSSRPPTRPFSRNSAGSPSREGLVSRGSQLSSVARLEGGKLVMTRSCNALDGFDRTVVVLPSAWAHTSKMIKSEKDARTKVARDAQLGVLKEGPEQLMRALNSHMRTHPDSSWQYMCML
mmetsp:Transcript_44640/g.106143  ORF Transcript_44640/g.106143 Transcript_44640/m.106143 type:complete len:363 (+) Transcript_44640:124-1212(+)